MSKRRTNAEIQEVERISNATRDLAYEISLRVNSDHDTDNTYVGVGAANIGGVRADYQKSHASNLVLSFYTKDAALMERVARAVKAVLVAEEDAASPTRVTSGRHLLSGTL